MGYSFLLTIRRHQVLPKTNAVFHQAPWFRHERQEERKEQKKAVQIPEKFIFSQEQVLRRGLRGIARSLRLPWSSHFQGAWPTEHCHENLNPKFKKWPGWCFCYAAWWEQIPLLLQNGKQQSHARGWLLLSQLWPGQRWANEAVITVLTAWHFPAVSPCICMEQPLEHTGTHSPSELKSRHSNKASLSCPWARQLSLEVVPSYGIRCF